MKAIYKQNLKFDNIKKRVRDLKVQSRPTGVWEEGITVNDSFFWLSMIDIIYLGLFFPLSPSKADLYHPVGQDDQG